MNFVNKESLVSSDSQQLRNSTFQRPSFSYLKKVKFLIVDDNIFMRSIVKYALGSLGVQHFREATDGIEALRVLQSFTPDIAIIDWEMAPLNGLKLVRIIRTESEDENQYMPIIMLSSYSEITRVTEARDAGVNEFVVKPMSVKSLYSRIDTLIHRPRNFVKADHYFGPDRRRRSEDIGIINRRDKANTQRVASPITAQVFEMSA